MSVGEKPLSMLKHIEKIHGFDHTFTCTIKSQLSSTYNSMAYPNPLECRSSTPLAPPPFHPKRYTCQIVNFHQPSKFKMYNMTHMSEKLWQSFELFLNSLNTRGGGGG